MLILFDTTNKDKFKRLPDKDFVFFDIPVVPPKRDIRGFLLSDAPGNKHKGVS